MFSFGVVGTAAGALTYWTTLLRTAISVMSSVSCHNYLVEITADMDAINQI